MLTIKLSWVTYVLLTPVVAVLPGRGVLNGVPVVFNSTEIADDGPLVDGSGTKRRRVVKSGADQSLDDEEGEEEDDDVDISP